MPNYIYETHTMADPLLPFIYHRDHRVAQKHSLPNWHENIELLQCTGGSGYVQCGPEQIPFGAGDLVVVNADTLHSVGSESSVRYRCLIIDNSFCLSNGVPISQLYFYPLIQAAQTSALFDAVAAAFDSEKEDRAAHIRWAVLGLLRELWAEHSVPKPSQRDPAANQRIKQVMAYIRQNLDQPMTLDEIAAYVGISKYHLSREFKALTGRTIVQTVNLIRCTEAKRLIESGMRVSIAAESCGFDNLSYFSRTFQKQFGILPSTLLPR